MKKNYKSIQKSTLVSIIMNCHNGEKYLNKSIGSILKQSYQNWELIFYNNNSSDESERSVKKFKDHRIKYFLFKKLLSLGNARNEALKNAKGDLIAFLDCDDIWYSEKLERQVPEFDDDKVGIVTCNTIFLIKKAEKILYKNDKPKIGLVARDLLRNYHLSLETIMIRKKALFQLDYWFDEDFNVIEEYDLLIRICFNWKLSYVDKEF